MSVAQHQNISHARPLRVMRHAALAAALVLAIAGCKGEQKTPDTAAQQAAPTATQTTAGSAQVVSAQVAAMSVDQLRTAAKAAQAEQRMYAPAGNNAMEYYLALRDKQPNDAAVASALSDLMPYALIATEQTIARDDFADAQRLIALMEKTDKSAPALPRLKQAIVDAQSTLTQRQLKTEQDAAAEKERLAKLEEDRKKQQEAQQQTSQQQVATQQAAAQQAAAQQAAAQQAAAQQTAQREAEQQRAAAQREAEQRAAQQAAAQKATEKPTSNDLRAISTPAPRYPTEALRAGQSGEVLVEFTVDIDGSVSSARVIRGNPPRVFDREAVAAVKRWRFQPVGAPVTTRRSIGFKPGG